MAEPSLSGLRVTLVGHAEPALVEATRVAFDASGRDVSVLADAAGSSAFAGADVAVILARRPSAVGILDLDDEWFAEQVERQLLTPQRAAFGAARAMAEGRGGSIVIVGSVDAYHAYPARSAPAVAMGGLLGLVRAMAVELASRGVRTNLVIAGPLGTEAGGPPPGAAEAMVERTLLRSPSHRFARPSEVAAAIRFVAGPDAAFMTGQTLRVDGGWASLNQAPEGMRFP